MNSMTALIIDDELLARFTLRKKLADFPQIEIIGEAGTIKDAIDKIQKLQPQILFLDIQLPDGDGFELLNQIEYSGKVIFVSAYDEYAIRAFKINAIDYILKPISIRRIRNAIEKLADQERTIEGSQLVRLCYEDRLLIMHKKTINFIKVSSIVSISASREYCNIHTINGKEFLSPKNISEWEEKLPVQYFCRIHRSTIINFEYIININQNINGTGEVLMQGQNTPLQISRGYFRFLKSKYSL